MKKKYILISLAMFAILAAVSGVALQAKAASSLMTERKAKVEAINTALTAGDYDAWVKANKALNENCPVLSKINAGNFSQYVEAYKLRAQADSILKDLGLSQGEHKSFGLGRSGDPDDQGGQRGDRGQRKRSVQE